MNEAKLFVNKRVKHKEPCDGRLSSTVPREGRVKFPPLTRHQSFACFFATLRQVKVLTWQNPGQLFVAQVLKKFN